MSNDTNDNPSRLDLDRGPPAPRWSRCVMNARLPYARRVRPDLSRLREEADRRRRIETRAGAFRMELRTRLGLADTQGPYSPLPLNTSGVIGHALCDADICTPEPPMAAAPRAPRKPIRLRRFQAIIRVRASPEKHRRLRLLCPNQMPVSAMRPPHRRLRASARNSWGCSSGLVGTQSGNPGGRTPIRDLISG